MKLSRLRHLVMVCETGTIREASRRLSLSQSSVTKSIRHLEEEMGVELLHRASHGVTPTEAGRAVIERAKRIEAELRYARNDVDEIQGTRIGELRLAVSPSVAMTLLPRVVIGFARTRPKVTFHVDGGVYPDILRPLRAGETDFAICLLPEPLRDEDLEIELLFKDAVTPAVRQGHPLASQRITMEVLAQQKWVALRSGRSSRAVFVRTFALAGVKEPENIIECNSFVSTLALVAHGDYVTMVPRMLLEDPLAPSKLVPIETTSMMPDWHVAVIYRAQTLLSPLGKAFLEDLRKVVKQVLTPSDRPSKNSA